MADRRSDRAGQALSALQAERRSAAQVVVSVGTDHHPFERLIGWIDEWRDLHPDVIVVVQAGTSSPSRHGSRDLIPHADLLELFRRAAVVVSHGGPSTVMDARMAGRLPVVVARDPAQGEHVDGHQLRFASHLERHGMAVVVSERDSLFMAIDAALDDPEAFTVTADHGSAVGVVEFARVVDELIDTRTPLAAGAVPADVLGSGVVAEGPPVAPTPVVDRRSRPAVDPVSERRSNPS